MGGDILTRIAERRLAAVAAARRNVSDAACERRAAARAPSDFRDFAGALAPTDSVRVIAEIKRASPSRGAMAADLDPVALAEAYAAGGAAALSVLTEPAFFMGSAADLQAARAATALPALRKDFILCRYQVYETVCMGADAMLLIVRMLDDETLFDLIDCAHDIGLATLVEIHDTADAGRIAGCETPLVGINNRDLASFHTDRDVSCRLAATLGDDCIVVAASGIASRADVLAAQSAGINRFLVGESLVTSGDPAATLRGLRGVDVGSG